MLHLRINIVQMPRMSQIIYSLVFEQWHDCCVSINAAFNYVSVKVYLSQRQPLTAYLITVDNLVQLTIIQVWCILDVGAACWGSTYPRIMAAHWSDLWSICIPTLGYKTYQSQKNPQLRLANWGWEIEARKLRVWKWGWETEAGKLRLGANEIIR